MAEVLIRKVIGDPVPELSGTNFPGEVNIEIAGHADKIDTQRANCKRGGMCGIMEYNLINIGAQTVSAGAFCDNGCPELQEFAPR